MSRSLRVLSVVVSALAVAGSAADGVKATVPVDRVVPESNQVMVRFSSEHRAAAVTHPVTATGRAADRGSGKNR